MNTSKCQVQADKKQYCSYFLFHTVASFVKLQNFMTIYEFSQFMNFMTSGRSDIVCKLEFINKFHTVVSFLADIFSFFNRLVFLINFNKTLISLSKIPHSPLWHPSLFYKLFCIPIWPILGKSYPASDKKETMSSLHALFSFFILIIFYWFSSDNIDYFIKTSSNNVS